MFPLLPSISTGFILEMARDLLRFASLRSISVEQATRLPRDQPSAFNLAWDFTWLPKILTQKHSIFPLAPTRSSFTPLLSHRSHNDPVACLLCTHKPYHIALNAFAGLVMWHLAACMPSCMAMRWACLVSLLTLLKAFIYVSHTQCFDALPTTLLIAQILEPLMQVKFPDLT